MKITKSKLNQIIKEEIEQLARGRSNISLTGTQAQNIKHARQSRINAKKIIRLLTTPDPWDFAQGLELYFLFKDDFEANAPKENSQILAKLKVIDQFTNSNIEDVDFLSGLSELNITEEIDLHGCDSLQNVNGLKGCTNLTRLDLSECESLENVDGLKGCTNLTRLDLSECESLQNVDGLQGLTNLTRLNLKWCESLQNVDGLEGCTNLTWLNLRGCRSLPIKLQQWFRTDNNGTAYNHFMKALNESKRNQP